MTEHECPKAFYCLPESCGDCPRDQQDEQATPITADEQMSEWASHPSDEPCGPRCDCGHCDEQAADMNDASVHYQQGWDAGHTAGIEVGIAEGERAATERIVKWHRRRGNTHKDAAIRLLDAGFSEKASRRNVIATTHFHAADAIERGKHE